MGPASCNTSKLCIPIQETVRSKARPRADTDTEASELQRTLEQTVAKLHDVYMDPTIQDPSIYPKVKKLNRTLSRVKKKLALVNMKRYLPEFLRNVTPRRASYYKALSRADTEASVLQCTLEQTEAKLHDVYGDPAIQDPSTHPKIKKLNRTLSRVKRKLALVN